MPLKSYFFKYEMDKINLVIGRFNPMAHITKITKGIFIYLMGFDNYQTASPLLLTGHSSHDLHCLLPFACMKPYFMYMVGANAFLNSVRTKVLSTINTKQ